MYLVEVTQVGDTLFSCEEKSSHARWCLLYGPKLLHFYALVKRIIIVVTYWILLKYAVIIVVH